MAWVPANVGMVRHRPQEELTRIIPTWSWRLTIITISFFTTTFNTCNLKASAQINPDNSLGVEGSRVNRSVERDIIEGGAIRGSNLFHSFTDFNVGTQQQVYFANPSGIQNIINRVTGKNSSQILGTLGVLGNANLFLINPNGIIFGENARLNVGGSFIASTADSFLFDNGFNFSSTNPQAPPLLTINVPIGLQFKGANKSGITVNGSNLTVPTNKTLGLVGGDITINGGRISAGGNRFLFAQGFPVPTTPGGKIELGSVLQGEVTLTPGDRGFSLGYAKVPNLGNIQITSAADVDVSGTGGGEIQINAEKLQLSDRARIISNTLDSQGGNITINSTESVELLGTGDFNQTLLLLTSPNTNLFDTRITGLYSMTFGAGNGGNLTINTNKFTARNNVGVFATTQGQGNSGNLALNASQSLEVTRSLLTTGVTSTATGNSGNLTMNTSRLLLQENGMATTTTQSTGKGGNLTVNADSVELHSSNPLNIYEFVSIGTVLVTGTFGDGDAGDLTINTRTLVIRELARILAGTINKGRGGNITINASEAVEIIGDKTYFAPELVNARSNTAIRANTYRIGQAGDIQVKTPSLRLLDGAEMAVNTFGSGKSGTIKINAGLVEVRGSSPDGGLSKSSISAFNAGLLGRGVGGSININADKLIVRDAGRVNAESRGNGDAGNLQMTAKEILLDNDGRLTAATVEGERGNIFLNADSIIMRRGSKITTDARGNNTVGGNIRINTDVLAALENSDITANSRHFRAGNIIINTQGLFGTALRVQPTPNSDITATGKNSQLQGNVQIGISDVDPTQGLTKLPSTLPDPSDRIVAGCPSNSEANFIITGRGGLPEDPRQVLRSQIVLQDMRDANSTSQNRDMQTRNIKNLPSTNVQTPIVEATGWIIDSKGQVELVANEPQYYYDNAKKQNCYELHSTSGLFH
jgi:filamentous hemagglutinin family protein